MRKFTHQEIVDRQKEKMKMDRLPFCVVLNNIRSLHNVGSIFRTADGVGVGKIWLCGITGYPPNNQISKTALGAEGHVEWEYAKNASEVIDQLKKQHYQIVLLEQTKGSVLYKKFVPRVPVCLVVGNEVEGVAEGILPYCDQAIEIEMAGVKNSLNVSVAFGIIAYYFRQCLSG